MTDVVCRHLGAALWEKSLGERTADCFRADVLLRTALS